MEEISYSGGGSKIRRRISKRLALFGIFFVIILLLLGSVVYFVTRSNSQEKDTKSITLEEDVQPQVTEEESTPSPEPSEAPSPTSKPSPVPTASGVSNSQKSSIKVAIQNGSGEAGVGGVAAEVLKKAGYDVVSTGNADNFDYTDVTIQVKAAKKSALALLEDDLSTDYTIGTTSSDLPADTSYDALVIIGK